MKAEILEKAKSFDKDGSMKKVVDDALEKLQIFRNRYPFAETPDLIDQLSPEEIFKNQSGEIGDFFHYIEYYLKPLGHLYVYSNVYHTIRNNIDIFKELLYVTVDKEKSLAEKVDAPWKEISGLGSDSHIAKKIIFCFNYETGQVVPIFSTPHLEYFLETILEKTSFPIQYENMSLGEKYQYLTEELLNAKDNSEITRPWEITYFCRFLYETFPPPKIMPETQRKALQAKAVLELQKIRSEFMELLNELRRQNKISAEQLREYRDAGFKNPETMQSLKEKLSTLKQK
ncbi:MAG: hypothetical protein ACQCN5_08410 [Candidatus Bathyarchaeia archaeon]|jgi:hypothetical protein